MRPGTDLNREAYVQETRAIWDAYGVVWRSLSDIKNLMADMTSPILKRLIEMCCRHNFSWPHTGVYGKSYQSYQVCLICGVVYAFDCSTMRRTGRLAAPMDSYTGNDGDNDQAAPTEVAG
jgi:hypothetical protein